MPTKSSPSITTFFFDENLISGNEWVILSPFLENKVTSLLLTIINYTPPFIRKVKIWPGSGAISCFVESGMIFRGLQDVIWGFNFGLQGLISYKGISYEAVCVQHSSKIPIRKTSKIKKRTK